MTRLRHATDRLTSSHLEIQKATRPNRIAVASAAVFFALGLSSCGNSEAAVDLPAVCETAPNPDDVAGDGIIHFADKDSSNSSLRCMGGIGRMAIDGVFSPEGEQLYADIGSALVTREHQLIAAVSVSVGEDSKEFYEFALGPQEKCVEALQAAQIQVDRVFERAAALENVQVNVNGGTTGCIPDGDSLKLSLIHI